MLWSSRRPRTILWSFRTAGFTEHWTRKSRTVKINEIWNKRENTTWNGQILCVTLEDWEIRDLVRCRRVDRASKWDGEHGCWRVKPLCLITG
jgi:hypothetical protein